MLSQDQLWKVIDAYFKENTIAAPEIRSYETFIKQLSQISSTAPAISYEVDNTSQGAMSRTRMEIQVLEVYPEVDSAQQPPNYSRLENETYEIPLKAKLRIQEIDIRNNVIENVEVATKALPFCRIPVMVGSKYCYLYEETKRSKIISGECPYDCGGYFIVNGSEKAVIAREVNRSNRIQVFNDKGEIAARIMSSIPSKQLYCKMQVKISSVRDRISNRIQQILLLTTPGISKPVNVFTMLAALEPKDSVTSQELIELITPEEDGGIIEELKDTLDQFSGLSPDESIEYLSDNLVLNSNENEMTQTKVLRFKEHLITRFMPHQGENEEDLPEKAEFLGYMCKLAILVKLNRRAIDDRDHWGEKRLQISGSLLYDLFKRCFEDFEKLIRKIFEDRKVQLSSFENEQRQRVETDFEKAGNRQISLEICRSLATGNWRTGRLGSTEGMKTGVAENMVRLSYAAAISQIRRASSGIEESSKAVMPRMLHGTEFGYLCPAETPEGAKVGLIKNFSLECYVTLGDDGVKEQLLDELTTLLDEFGSPKFCHLNELGSAGVVFQNGVKVFLNGRWIGNIEQSASEGVAAHLRRLRSEQRLSAETGICLSAEQGELILACDEGRVMRPLLVVNSEIDETMKVCIDMKMNLTPTITDEVCGTIGSPTPEGAWKRLVTSRDMYIEYLDPYEEEEALIAPSLSALREEQEIVEKTARWLSTTRQHEHGVKFSEEDVLEVRDQERVFPAEDVESNESEPAPLQIEPHILPRLPIAYTHVELHAALMLSAIAAIIPFPDHNQSPRNLYQSSMGKQAVGIYALNFCRRFDTSGINVLHYPQRPLVQTRMLRYVRFTELPAGENLVVAIAVYTGFNQEDSLIMSHAAVDRGLMRCTYFEAHEAICEIAHVAASEGDLSMKLCRPQNVKAVIDPTCKNYLDADGLPRVGASVRAGKVVIGRIAPLLNQSNAAGATGVVFVDKSECLKNDEIGYVDACCLTLGKAKEVDFSDENGGELTAKVRVRANRPPEMGDKFASRHGQKGTVGMLYRQEDLPFTFQHGITPDIIMNPHAIPSRMTIGQLLECVGSKFASIVGRVVDATPFEPPMAGDSQEEFLTESLQACGFESTGYEAMECGYTGRLLEYRIFIGPTFYQRLKHMVLDKVSARATGPLVTTTRQPNEGRERYGGMRVGEMERDAFIAHGAAAVLRDRLMFASDAAEFLICRKCGEICWHANMNEITVGSSPYCRACGRDAAFCRVTLPFATKYLFEEIIGMGIFPSIKVEVD